MIGYCDVCAGMPTRTISLPPDMALGKDTQYGSKSNKIRLKFLFSNCKSTALFVKDKLRRKAVKKKRE